MQLTQSEIELILKRRKESSPQIGVTRLQRKNAARKFTYVVVSVYNGVVMLATESGMKDAAVFGGKLVCECTRASDWKSGNIWLEWDLV